MVFREKQLEIDIEDAFDGKHWDSRAGQFRHDSDNLPPSLLEVINDKLSTARSRTDRARKEEATEDKIKAFDDEIASLEGKLQQAIDLTRELSIEADVLQRNPNDSATSLKLSQNSISSGSEIMFMQYSVYEWALDNHDIEIREWARPGTIRPRRARKYTTKLLEILDAIIEEFYEDVDPQHPPKNAAIIAWVEREFPNEKTILSKKMLDSMCKIVRT